MINQPDILDALGTAFEEKQAIALTHAMSLGINSAVEHRTKDMADLKDLDVITSKMQTDNLRIANRMIIWFVGTSFALLGVGFALFKYL